MILHVNLKVKFRAFFITFANFEKTWDLPVPVQIPGINPGTSLIHFSDRGVTLDVKLLGVGVQN